VEEKAFLAPTMAYNRGYNPDALPAYVPSSSFSSLSSHLSRALLLIHVATPSRPLATRRKADSILA
jgi:hypothetical protein